MRWFKLGLLAGCVMVVGLLAGCATSVPFQKASVDQSGALVYVFRPESLLSRGTIIKVDVNGTTKGLLVNNSYLPMQLAAGKTTITLLTNDFVGNKFDTLTITTQKGMNYYIKAEPGAWGAFKLLVLDEQKGLSEVSSTVYYQTK